MFGLGVYGPSKVTFTKVIDKQKNKSRLVDVLYSALYDKARREDKGWKPLSQKKPWNKFYLKFVHSSIGYGFYCFRNKTKYKAKVTLTAKTHVNIQFCKILNFFEFLF